MADEISIVVRAEDQFSNVLGNFGNIMTGIKSTIDLVAGAFRGVVDFGKQFTDEASASQDALANLDATLRSTSGAAGMSHDALVDLATSFQSVTRFSDETILNGEAMLLTFTNIGQDVFPQATEAMLNLAQKFGSVDAASVQLGKALQDPINGVTALRRVGVMLTDQQEEQIKKFVEAGDVMSAQKIILGELEKEFGGLAVAMGDTFTGKWDIFMNKISDVKEGIGGLIIYGLTPLMDLISGDGVIALGLNTFNWLLSTLVDYLNKGVPPFQALALILAELPSHSDLVGSLSANFLLLKDALLEMQKVMDDGGSVWDAFETGLTTLTAAGGPLGKLSGMILDVKNAFDSGGLLSAIDTFVADITNEITNKINDWVIGNGPKELSDKLISWITDVGKMDDQGNSKALAAIGGLVNAVLLAIVQVDWSGIGTAIDNAISGAINNNDWTQSGIAIREGLGKIFSSENTQGDWSDPNSDKWSWLDNMPFMIAIRFIKAIFSSDTASSIGNAVSGLFKGAFDPSSDKWNWLDNLPVTMLYRIILGLVNGIRNHDWSTLLTPAGVETMNGFIEGINTWRFGWDAWWHEHIIDPVKRVLGIASPSTVFLDIGKDIVRGFINGIDSLTDWALGQIKNILKTILAPFKGILDALGIDTSAIWGDTSTGTVGGQPGTHEGPGGVVTGTGSATVVNNYFYGPVSFGDLGQLGYDCPSPNPLVASSGNSSLVFNGLG